MSLNPSAILAPLKSLLNQLVRSGSITHDDASYLIAYYMGGNCEVCSAWFRSKNNKDADEIDVLEALESEITRPQLL